MLENISKELEKGFKDLSKVSSELIEKQKVQGELRALNRTKQKAYLELGKRVFSICEEKDTIGREDFLDLISQIKNADELIKNVKYNATKKAEYKDKNDLGGSVMADDEVEN